MKGFVNIFDSKGSFITKFFDVLLWALIGVLFVLLIVYTLYMPVIVDGSSMMNTYLDGNIVAISKTDRNFAVGDVVVIDKGEYNIIKRVIAVSGDEIAFYKGADGVIRLYRNGFDAPVVEDYIKEDMTVVSNFSACGVARSMEELLSGDFAIKIGDGELFVMGDNRNVSLDSRATGAMKVSAVKGKTVALISGNFFLEAVFGLAIYNKETSR